jgi:hypothetical protein
MTRSKWKWKIETANDEGVRVAEELPKVRREVRRLTRLSPAQIEAIKRQERKR